MEQEIEEKDGKYLKFCNQEAKQGLKVGTCKFFFGWGQKSSKSNNSPDCNGRIRVFSRWADADADTSVVVVMKQPKLFKITTAINEMTKLRLHI